MTALPSESIIIATLQKERAAADSIKALAEKDIIRLHGLFFIPSDVRNMHFF